MGLEIKLIVPSKTASYIIVFIDLALNFTLLGSHITDFVASRNARGIGISFIVINIINMFLALLLLAGICQKNIRKCQFHAIGWFLSWLYVFITLLIFLLVFQPFNTPLTFYFQIVLYPILLLYKPISLFIVNKFVMEVIREGREQRQGSKHDSFASRKGSYSAKNRENQNAANGSKSPLALKQFRTLQSPSVNHHPFQYGTTGRRRDSDIVESVQGVEDLLHEIEFPTENQVPSYQFKIGEKLLKMDHDFFVKKGILTVPIGGFGSRTKTSGAKTEDVEVAIKIFRQNVDVDAVRRMLLETKILTMFSNHSNVIKLLAFCTENIHKGKMTLLLEFTEKGTLEDFLKRNYNQFQDLIVDDEYKLPVRTPEERVENKDVEKSLENIYENVMSPCAAQNSGNGFPFTSKALLNWSFQIANGVEAIHSKGIVHGNLLARNCIVDDRHRIKIANFTFATQLCHYQRTGNPIDFNKIEMPWRWMAIENMRDDPPEEISFTEKSDVWGYGILLWEMFSMGCTPYEGLPTAVFFPKLIDGERLEKPTFSTTQVYDTMKSCWHISPSRRPSFPTLKKGFTEILQTLM